MTWGADFHNIAQVILSQMTHAWETEKLKEICEEKSFKEKKLWVVKNKNFFQTLKKEVEELDY